MYLPAGSLIILNSTIKLSEHNRRPVSFNHERIEKTQRMSNGTMRKFFVVDKRSLTMSWEMLPSKSNYTVDGGYGALDIKAFYEGSATKASGALSGQNTFDVRILYGAKNGGTAYDSYEDLEMLFTSCSFEIIRRNVKQNSSDTYPQEFWNVSLTMEQV